MRLLSFYLWKIRWVYNYRQKKNIYHFYNFGIFSGEIIRTARPIIIKGDTNENNASNATTIPAAGIGRPVK